MLFSDSLEVALGLTFVFLLVSLVLMVVTETVEAWMRTRGSTLLDGIVELVADPNRRGAALAAARSLYEHPLIHGLYRGDFDRARRDRRLPSYIPARNFALALVDQVMAARLDAEATDAGLPVSATPAERLRLAAERIQSEPLRRAVKQAARLGGDDMERIRQHLEAWYDSAMDRVSGGYRRRTQVFLFWFGLGAAVLLNINAITIADSLSQNAALRRAIAEQAEHFAREDRRPAAGATAGGAVERPPSPPVSPADQRPTPAPDAPSGRRQPASPAPAATGRDGGRATDRGVWTALDEIEQIGLPIGWSDRAQDALLRPWRGPRFLGGLGPFFGVVQIALGFLMTALAATLGAPFWFDVLNRLMVVRATVKPHEKSPEEASQDPQAPPRRDATLRVAVVGAAPTTAGPARPAGPAGPHAEDADPVVHRLDPMHRPREEADHDPAYVKIGDVLTLPISPGGL